MYAQGRGLKVTAVSAMVVLALTGFSSGHAQGSRDRHGDDGGGCSSSRQDHDSSSPSPGGDASDSGSSRPRSTSPSTPTASPSTSTASPSATPRPLKNGTAALVRCASVADPYAVVEVRNPNGRDAVFFVKMTFKNGRGLVVMNAGDQVSVPAKGRTTYRVSAISSGLVEEIAHCEVDPIAVANW